MSYKIYEYQRIRERMLKHPQAKRCTGSMKVSHCLYARFADTDRMDINFYVRAPGQEDNIDNLLTVGTPSGVSIDIRHAIDTGLLTTYKASNIIGYDIYVIHSRVRTGFQYRRRTDHYSTPLKETGPVIHISPDGELTPSPVVVREVADNDKRKLLIKHLQEKKRIVCIRARFGALTGVLNEAIIKELERRGVGQFQIDDIISHPHRYRVLSMLRDAGRELSNSVTAVFDRIDAEDLNSMKDVLILTAYSQTCVSYGNGYGAIRPLLRGEGLEEALKKTIDKYRPEYMKEKGVYSYTGVTSS